MEQGLQRAKGRVHVSLLTDGSRGTVLRDLHQSGCSKAMVHGAEQGGLDVVILNTAGGLTGGDQIDISVDAGARARVRVATQTAERVYRSLGPQAQIQVMLTVGPAASLAWLPQETILFDRAAIDRRIEVDLAPDADFLMVEPLVFGRRAMGEVLSSVQMTDTWRIRQAGRLIHAEAFRLTGSFAEHQGPGCLDGAGAVASLLFVGPDPRARLGALRAMTGDNCRVAASAWDGRLLARFMAADPRHMRARVMAALQLFGTGPLPRVWTM